MRITVPVVLAVASLAPIPTTGAATLFSPMVNAANSGRLLRCSVVNVGSETKDVTFEIVLASNGSTLVGPLTRTIPPGGSTFISTAQTGLFQYCKVQAPGSKTALRGHFAIEVNLGGGDTEMRLSVPLE